MAGNGEGEGSRGNNRPRPFWNQVEETRRIHESFIPKNKYGNPIPRNQRWGNAAFEDDLAEKRREFASKIAQMEAWLAEANFGPNDAAIKDNIRRLFELDQAAKRAEFRYDVPEPRVGDFKVNHNRNNQGTFKGPKKIQRYTTAYWKKVDDTEAGYEAALAAAPTAVAAPVAGDYKKIGNKLFRWMVEPAWLQVDRKTDYDIDLADTFARTNALGKPYFNARDHLWSIFYPEEPPIFRPARFRGRRNTRRTNRRKANRRKNNTRKY